MEHWPLAFGFRPGRSPEDGNVVTKLLLELSRMKGLQVTCTGLNYEKCFDLTPQGMVFEVRACLGFYPVVNRHCKPCMTS